MNYRTKFFENTSFKKEIDEKNINEWLLAHPYIEIISMASIDNMIIITYKEALNDKNSQTKKSHNTENPSVERHEQTVLAPKWIYGNPLSIDFDDAVWQALDDALGFKLFYWQKYLIANGELRCCGETNARIIHHLLTGPLEIPIILRRYDGQDRLNRQYREIREKLVNHGFKCREIKYNINYSEG